MKLKPAPLVIPEDDPFKNDALGRKPMIESLTTLVSDVTPPFVICVDSPWGTGKTTFLELWRAHLRKLANRSLSILYFNAWETDFAEDPLVAFVGEIATLAESTDVEKMNAGQIGAVKKIGGELARRSLSTASTPGGVVSTKNENNSDSDPLMGPYQSTSVIEEYEGTKKLIEKFRSALKSLIDGLTKDADDPRLVVFVDELDRCRPSYALSFLERTKHLLNTPNVVFVLALDKKQLHASIETAYGSRTDSENYLRRFIDLEFSLRVNATNPAFADYLFGQFDFQPIFAKRLGPVTRYDASNLKGTFVELSTLFGLSLRAQAQCFTRFRIALQLTTSNFLIYPELLALLVVLRMADRDVYEKFISASGSASDLLNCVSRQFGGNAFLKSRSGIIIEAIAIAAKRIRYGQMEPPEFTRYQKLIAQPKSPGTKLSEDQERAQAVMEHIAHISKFDASPDLDYVVSKIELTKDAKY